MSNQFGQGPFVINSKYRVEGEIGKGGLGIVYIATDMRLKRPVAIKMLLHDQTNFDNRYGEGTYEHYLSRFEREATVSSYFTANPNIITVHGLEQGPNAEYYLILEYLDGGSLAQLVKERGALSIEQTCAIALDICRALADIHNHPTDIVHRDLKPANILLRRNGQAVVADFGIAQVGHESQRTVMAGLTHPGSPPYMSPEQRNTNDYLTPASDLYSVGLLMYEMLTGRLYAKYQRLPPSLDNANVPYWLDQIVGQLLREKRQERYQQAEEVIAAIEQGRRVGYTYPPSVPTGGPDPSATTASQPGQPYSQPAAYTQLGGDEDRTLPVNGPLTPKPDTRAPTIVQAQQLFISYKHGAEPDETIAQQVLEALGQQHKIFVDQTLPGGNISWAERVETELRQSDYLIIFLSGQSAVSEMVETEVRLAHHLAKSQGGRPVIVPVRLNYRKPLDYPLSAYLEGVKTLSWDKSANTPMLIEALQRVINSGKISTDPVAPPTTGQSQPDGMAKPTSLPAPQPAAQIMRLELPEGTMDSQSGFYVERPSDRIALEAIERQGVTITVKGPRQMGKSSLLLRIGSVARQHGKRVALLDFQLFDHAALNDADTFFRQFCDWLSDELDLESRVTEYWNMPLGNSQRCTRYMQRFILKELGGPLLLAMDEVETIFDTDFRSDFFGMLRSWHNSRQTNSLWKQLDLALVTSTEPYQLIENLNQSPFNVGEVIELADFTPEQIADLNRRHNSPLTPEQERQLITLLSGHPYLVRRALYLIAGERYGAAQLFAEATDDQGPFGDHLRNHLFRLHDQPELKDGLRLILQTHTCPDDRIFFRLRGAGLVKREGRSVVPRCQLYATYFQEHV